MLEHGIRRAFLRRTDQFLPLDHDLPPVRRQEAGKLGFASHQCRIQIAVVWLADNARFGQAGYEAIGNNPVGFHDAGSHFGDTVREYHAVGEVPVVKHGPPTGRPADPTPPGTLEGIEIEDRGGLLHEAQRYARDGPAVKPHVDRAGLRTLPQQPQIGRHVECGVVGIVANKADSWCHVGKIPHRDVRMWCVPPTPNGGEKTPKHIFVARRSCALSERTVMKRWSIGIDLGGTNLKGILLDEQGESHHLMRTSTEADKGGERVLENILNLVGKLIKAHGSPDSILGVGIGSPGFVDRGGTVVGGAENLPGWKGMQIFTPIKKQFGLQAVASNDVTVTALAESRFGAGKDLDNLVCLALGTGIGGGIVVNRRVYMGRHGMAGELGHICVEPDGLRCNCGNNGCVEQYASASGIVKNARIICDGVLEPERTPFVEAVLKDPHAVTSKMVYEHVTAKDRVALQVHEYVCERLARAVGIILNSLAPDRIILGGGVMKAGQVIVDGVYKYVGDYCWPEILERCDIVAAQCGEHAGVLGAAALAFDELGGGI